VSAAESLVSTHVKRVLTGYRPTGPLHVGHWAGNIESMLRVQGDAAYDCFYFMAAWTRGLVLD
jgi:tryptophanyl-tRNA synthetase